MRLDLSTCSPLPDELKFEFFVGEHLTCQEMFYMPMVRDGCRV